MTNVIIEVIVKAHLEKIQSMNLNNSKKDKGRFKFYFHEDVQLNSVQTNESDMKKKISKIPRNGETYMSLDELRVTPSCSHLNSDYSLFSRKNISKLKRR